MAYIDRQKDKNAGLIKNCTALFDGIEGGKEYRGKPYGYILKEGKYNLYKEIRDEVQSYFEDNKITWWRGKVTGNTLSSQIACLNHLFPIRNDKGAVLRLVQGLDPGFTEVKAITYNSEKQPGYIAFETVCEKDYLNECAAGASPTRGANYTSIDALIFAKHKSRNNVLILIEWKYTESYSGDKSKGNSGLVRMNRYNGLIDKSGYLVSLSEYNGSVYYREPFYQLMRQTLWAEQIIKHKDVLTASGDRANDYLHIHVIPNENEALLKNERLYRFSKKSLKDTWEGQLKDKGHYKIVDPEELFTPSTNESFVDEIEGKKDYSKLIDYLKVRYW
ncbi:MAG: hypothetical protein LUE27_02385 [Clostridia bacterium]|nr:hypothetical protein [Clostridia bacterium]